MRAFRSWLGLLGTLALAGLCAPAGAQPVGSEFQINAYTTDTQAVLFTGRHLVGASASGSAHAHAWLVALLVGCAPGTRPVLTPAPTTAGLPRESTTRDVTLGPLYFDPQGADFASWMKRFKNEVYRNWVVPQKALLTAKGHVDFEFVVERNGSVSGLRKLRSTVPTQLEEAARNALAKSQLAELPREFSGERVTMQLTFYYREDVR